MYKCILYFKKKEGAVSIILNYQMCFGKVMLLAKCHTSSKEHGQKESPGHFMSNILLFNNVKWYFLEVFQAAVLPLSIPLQIYSQAKATTILNLFWNHSPTQSFPGKVFSSENPRWIGECSMLFSHQRNHFLLHIYGSLFIPLSRHVRHKTRVRVIWALNSIPHRVFKFQSCSSSFLTEKKCPFQSLDHSRCIIHLCGVNHYLMGFGVSCWNSLKV